MKSNKIGDIIKRLMEIRDQYGDDVEVKADTQDGACYSVSVNHINVENWGSNSAGNNRMVVYIDQQRRKQI